MAAGDMMAGRDTMIGRRGGGGEGEGGMNKKKTTRILEAIGSYLN